MQPAASPLNHFSRRSTAESAADYIRQAIICGDLPMGASLSEAAIAEKLNISRTPVREAIRQLAMEGLVQLRPFAGASVFRVNRAELRHLAAFREMLEVTAIAEAIRLHKDPLVAALDGVVAQMRDAVESEAAHRFLMLDSEFHETILKFADNPLLCEAYQLVASRFKALRTFIASDPGKLTRSLASHAELVTLIASGDLALAQAALVAHMRNWEKNFAADSALHLGD
ncbi:GntR family transcriptional regulator [Cupriavidus consociatus]|uniref:GntR family transcriptional regulator n=1 Tax=Cupriavidus consociatus TaxID=2821357 RepID=UPI001AE71150|nr:MULTISPECIES: GntR family transcriptional regulator [unclassified Cupriavidus]MBP0623346.1 GntR family transcriptional regulator [Cupriavidus sp. LEh25]MDK2660044.1 GntR family transcriptional regulator [Cupriavidus sp. LEh21]